MMQAHCGATSAARTYQSDDIATADPLGLIVRVFELATSHLAKARVALAAGDRRTKGLRIHETSRCLSVLQSCLDMQRGEDAARNFDRLYTYFQIRLIQGHRHDDDVALAEVARHLTVLGQAWREARR